jgi:hypothetical protein
LRQESRPGESNKNDKEIEMLLPNRMKNTKLLLVLGMSCLVVAIVSSNTPVLTHLFGPGWGEGVRGFLLGLSISLNLWSVLLASRQRQNQNGCRVA